MSKKIDLEKEQERLKELKEKAEKKSKRFLTEFKQFATKGNVIDMAIGVIIGTAFASIVTALTDDFINPIINSIYQI